MSLLRLATPGKDFAVSGLPEPSRPRLTAEHHGVIPAQPLIEYA
jgi:hypothetical protein